MPTAPCLSPFWSILTHTGAVEPSALRLLDLLEDPRCDLDLIVVLDAAGVVAVLDRAADARERPIWPESQRM